MEVAGLTASIITLISATTLAGSAVIRVWGLRGLPLYIQAALNEINDFKATLMLVRDAHSSLKAVPSDSFDAEVVRLIARADERLTAFNTYMKEKVLRDGPTHTSEIKLRRRAKLKEIFGEAQSELGVLQQELASIKLGLTTALVAVQIRTSARLLLDIQRISIIRNESSQSVEVDGPHSATTILEQAAASGAALVSQQCSPSALDTHDHLAMNDEYVRLELQARPSDCHSSCPCRCHVPTQGGSPRWLQGLIGSGFYRFTGAPLLSRRSCDAERCLAGSNREGSLRLEYSFPTWILPYVIQLTGSWCTTSGRNATWSIRIPRVFHDDSVHRTLVKVATGGSATQFCRALVEFGVGPFDIFSHDFEVPLIVLALSCGRIDICLMLLDNGATLDFNFRDPQLTFAQELYIENLPRNGFSRLMNHPVMIAAGRNLDIPIAYYHISRGRDTEIVSYLSRNATAITERELCGQSLLCWAALCCNVKAVRLILAAGADVNATGRDGRTPFMLAAIKDCIPVCQVLLDAGADVNIIDERGNDVLSLIVIGEPSQELMEMVLGAKPDVERQYSRGFTALMLAAAIPHLSLELCTLLLDYGADLNPKSAKYRSPLVLAIEAQNHETMKLLLKRMTIDDSMQLRDLSYTISAAATWGDTYTMIILQQHICNCNISPHPRLTRMYWEMFDARPKVIGGVDQDIQGIRVAFKALLDSVMHTDTDEAMLEVTEMPQVPGAFPACAFGEG
ncbi:hypothetical protein C7974DRAFT_393786 [Boeremia exigua]|uniref:uncharacterized protein n=1 Tax=Boeremia exigua TaxID=749465 RepID=UPI001E8D3311|nr:uncharacterized protein C7974DRAFT_393786 [Boeremia exigua]KAH6629071.1 hypothetical protein C7974DRAFT_393786 [Boeremia exigua]